MPRFKTKDEPENNGINKLLHKQDNVEEGAWQELESDDMFTAALKGFLNDELQKISLELRDIHQDCKDLQLKRF